MEEEGEEEGGGGGNQQQQQEKKEGGKEEDEHSPEEVNIQLSYLPGIEYFAMPISVTCPVYRNTNDKN